MESILQVRDVLSYQDRLYRVLQINECNLYADRNDNEKTNIFEWFNK